MHSPDTDLAPSFITEILLLYYRTTLVFPCASTFLRRDPVGACCSSVRQSLATGFLPLIFMGNWLCSTWNQRPAGDTVEGKGNAGMEETEVTEACLTFFPPLFTMFRYSILFFFHLLILCFLRFPQTHHALAGRLYIYIF